MPFSSATSSKGSKVRVTLGTCLIPPMLFWLAIAPANRMKGVLVLLDTANVPVGSVSQRTSVPAASFAVDETVPDCGPLPHSAFSRAQKRAAPSGRPLRSL